VTAALAILLSLGALWFPIANFLRVLPNIAELYNHPLRPGWGLYIMASGLVMLMLVSIGEVTLKQPR
jgi:hypothetical protein